MSINTYENSQNIEFLQAIIFYQTVYLISLLPTENTLSLHLKMSFLYSKSLTRSNLFEKVIIYLSELYT